MHGQAVDLADCPSRLLTDDPSEEDLLGSHQRLADLIAETISSDSGGKAIALTGGYGSGKSTVIRLLRGALRSRKSIASVFVFDSWAHQSDPLRRSFLEELTRFLVEVKWLKEKEGQTHLDALGRRSEESTIATEPVLTQAGGLVAISALLVPLGYVLLSHSFDDHSKVPAQLWGVPTVQLGLGLVFAPLIAATIVYLSWRPTWKFWTSRFWRSHRKPHEHDRVLGFFMQKSREQTRSTTWRTPEPTTIEFQSTFGTLLQQAIGSTHRTLVLVIDNLDRLPTDQAQTVWATMRTFVELTPQPQPERERLWLVVPIGSSDLDSIWPRFADRSTTTVFDKTFQLAVPVSPPVLSDWRGFLLKQLSVAFPKHTPVDDFEQIYRLYRLSRSRDDRQVTPREIKLFVNQLVLHHREWRHQIPLPVMAAFELHKGAIGAAPAALTATEFLSPSEQGILGDPKWAQEFAALHFNVPLANALQVLIGTALATALVKGDNDALEQLSNTRGFEAVCEQVVDDSHGEWGLPGGEALIRATSALLMLGRKGLAVGHAQKLLMDDCRQHQSWSLDEALAEGIIEIVDSVESVDDRRELFLNFIGHVTAPSMQTGAESVQVVAWAKGYLRLLTVAPVVLRSDELALLGIHGSIQSYMGVIAAIGAQRPADPSVLQYCRPLDAAPDDVVTALVERVTSKQFSNDDAVTIGVLLTMRLSWPWPAFLNAANARLSDFTSPTAVESSIVRSLLRLSGANVSAAQQVLQQLATKGAFLHQLYLTQAAGDPLGNSLSLLASVIYLPSGDSASTEGQIANGQAYYKQVVANPSSGPSNIRSLSTYAEGGALITQLLDAAKTHQPTRTLVQQLVTTLLEPAPAESLVPLLATDRLVELQALLPPTGLAALLRKLGSDRLYANLTSAEFNNEIAPIYKQVIEIWEAPPNSFTTMLVGALQNLPKDVWDSELREAGSLLPLALTLPKREVAVDLGQPLQDALLDLARHALSNQALPPQPPEGWTAVIRLLGTGAQRTLMRDLRDELISRPDGNLGLALQLGGDALLDSDVLVDKADDIVRRVGRSLVDGSDASALGWLERALSPDRGLLGKAETETRISFRDRVTAVLDAQDTTAPATPTLERLKSLADLAAPPGSEDVAENQVS